MTVDVARTLTCVVFPPISTSQLFVVGVTNDINVAELKNIASRPIEEHYFEVTKIRYLNPLRDEIIRNICHSLN